MKTMSAGLETHYAGDCTTIATCWLITRRDGQVFAFTDHVSDLSVSGITYSATTGYTASAMSSSDKMNVDNLEIDGYFDSAAITKEDLKAGKWDFASIRIFEVNYNDLTQGTLKLRKGWLGEVNVNEGRFTVELRGLTQAVQQNIGRTVSPSCDADVGDARCKINLATFPNGTVTGALTSRASNQSFTDLSLAQATGWFNGGKITFTSGLNNGLSMEVSSFVSGGNINLKLPMPFTVAVSDTYTMTVGCDKTRATCKTKFSNVINFRGFPNVPGTNKLLSGK